jgi:hypothetical protein
LFDLERKAAFVIRDDSFEETSILLEKWCKNNNATQLINEIEKCCSKDRVVRKFEDIQDQSHISFKKKNTQERKRDIEDSMASCYLFFDALATKRDEKCSRSCADICADNNNTHCREGNYL